VRAAYLLFLGSPDIYRGSPRLSLARWYNKVDDSGFKSFNVIAATLYEHYDEVLNFFVNRATNAFAESFNAKIKAFRAALRGVTDIKFFLFRLTKLYA
jgi:transposase